MQFNTSPSTDVGWILAAPDRSQCCHAKGWMYPDFVYLSSHRLDLFNRLKYFVNSIFSRILCFTVVPDKNVDNHNPSLKCFIPVEKGQQRLNVRSAMQFPACKRDCVVQFL